MDLNHLLDQFFCLDITHTMDTSDTVTKKVACQRESPSSQRIQSVPRPHSRPGCQHTRLREHAQSLQDLLPLAHP
jgi:hypothetical protein